MTALLGVVLAGGKASRMGGGDKSLLPLAGRRVIDHVLERLQLQVSDLALNANGDPTRFTEFGLPVVADSVSEFPGPLAGVLAGLDWAAEQGVDHILTVAADTPFFPMDLRSRLEQARVLQAKPIALAATQGFGKLYRHPTFGLWPVSLRDDLRQALATGMRKVVLWTDQHGAAETLFSSDGYDPFFNINTPEDLVKAEAMK
jgi:molybdopterin-guanine dinucleotide biosynthesis protein A